MSLVAAQNAHASGAPRAVVLLSGGLDSTTVLAMARDQGYRVHALAFDYGQRQRIELQRAEQAARTFGAEEFLPLSFDLRAVGGSALTSQTPVPKHQAQPGGSAPTIPVTYVPARNTVFLAHALGLAEARGAYDIFVGVSQIDYSGYPDCRPAFLSAFETLANLATRAADGGPRYKIHAPLLHLSKAQTIALGLSLGVDYAHTHSCYDPNPSGHACGVCDACALRRNGFAAAGVPDPTVYAAQS